MSSTVYVFLTPAATIAAVLITLVFTNRREEKRQTHERELKRMEFENQEKQRAREGKVEVYSHLLSETTVLDPTADAPLREVSELVSRIELLADSEVVLNAVHRMYYEYYMLDKVGREVRQKRRDPSYDPRYVEGYKKLNEARNHFFRTAKRDLGLYAGEEEKEILEDVDKESETTSTP